MKSGRWFDGSAVLAAAGASACCLGPLVLAVLGLGTLSGAVSAFFAPLRPWFLCVAFGIVGWRLVVLYRPRRSDGAGACCERAPEAGAACAPAGLRRERAITWAVVVFISAFAASPHLLAFLPFRTERTAEPATSAAVSVAPAVEVCLTIDGMTCAACARHIEKALAEVPGVVAARVDMDRAEACLVLDDRTPPSSEGLVAAVEAAGYRAKPKASGI